MSIVVLAVVILLLSAAGGFAPRLFASRLTDERLQDVTGFASGILLASALLVVIPEGFHVAADGSGDGLFADEPVVLGAAVLLGFVLMLVLEGLGVGHAVHEEHHLHAEGHGHGHVHHPRSSGVLAVGLSVHAAADGLAIGSAAVAGDATFSMLVALAVLLHRVPAAFSLGMFAIHETGDLKVANAGIIGFALATPVTILVSYLVLDSAGNELIALSLLFSAGTFVYVATVDTLPEIHNPEVGRRALMNVLLGAALFSLIFVGVDTADLLDHSH